jgi:hypothetical protein
MMRKNTLIALFALLIMVLASCTSFEDEVCLVGENDGNGILESIDVELNNEETVDENATIEAIGEVDEDVVVKTLEIEDEEKVDDENSDYDYKLEGVEGDLMFIDVGAEDPDGDSIEFIFSQPFNANGLWQTYKGDAGEYLIDVVAKDGVIEVTNSVLVSIAHAPKAPVLECPESVRVSEGEELVVDCNAFSPDGRDVVITYSGFMKSYRKYISFDDAGEYTVLVTAADKILAVDKKVKIIVNNVNRAPELSSISDMEYMEGDVVSIIPEAIDADDNEVAYTYSKPFNSKGIFRTEVGDAGEYNVDVVASDGELSDKTSFKLVVKQINTAPVIKEIGTVEVYEGDMLNLNIEVTDREDENVLVTVEGYMDSDSKEIGYDEAYPNGCSAKGCSVEKSVRIKATDGFLTTYHDVTVVVHDKNRAPVFNWN